MPNLKSLKSQSSLRRVSLLTSQEINRYRELGNILSLPCTSLRKVVWLICSGRPCFRPQQLPWLGPTKHRGRGDDTAWEDPGPPCAGGREHRGPLVPSLLQDHGAWGIQSQRGAATVELAIAFHQLRVQQKGKGSCAGMRQNRASLRVIILDTWLCSPPSGSLLIPIKNPLPEA